MTPEQAIDLIKLLAAIESWSYCSKEKMPDYLYEQIDGQIDMLTDIALTRSTVTPNQE